MKKILNLSFGFFAAIGLLALAPAAKADVIYQFTVDHCTGGCGASDATPLGTITLAQDGTDTVKVVVNLVSADGFVQTGFDGSFGFNLIANSSVTISNLTSGWSTVGSQPLSAGSLHFDGFGNFEYGLTCGNNCHANSPFFGPLSFDVTASGLIPDSFAQQSSGGSGAYFVGDISVPDPNNQGLRITGAVGAYPTSQQLTQTPEPASLALLGAGLFGIGFVRRRRRA